MRTIRTKIYFLIFALLAGFFQLHPTGHAAVADWYQGISINPQSNTDFASQSFQQSVQNAAATGANTVTLIVPLYQSNLYTTDIQKGWNTPTDAALTSAIRYIRSQGMGVMLKFHVQSYTGEWRAYINPSDRAGWFANYGTLLKTYATLAAQEGVSTLCLGTELISMASSQANASNTQYWKTLISDIRKIYGGKLTYSANWGPSGFVDEKNAIAFWDSLDFIGISAYFNLWGDNSVQNLKNQWDAYRQNDIEPLKARWNKPVVFTEIGYKSMTNAHTQPWDYNYQNSVNEQEQANAYQALFEYWNSYPWMQGVLLWEWSADPNAGGANNGDYTPQHKKAEGVMKTWFSNTPAPQPSQCPGPASNAFAGCYYSDRTLNSLVFTRTDSQINFDWAAGSPDPKVPNEWFSARWQGNFNFTAGTYTFTALADDGVRVYVDSQLIIDQWKDQAATRYEATRTLSAGQHTITMEYFETGGNAVAKLSWASGNSTPPPPPPPPASSGIDLWWPINNAEISGLVPLKGLLQNYELSTYTMYWQVDSGSPVLMYDSNADYPHKEYVLDVSGWSWKGRGPYTLTFTAKNAAGTVLATKSVNIYVSQ